MVALQEYDFHILWPTVRLLTLLLANKTREIQEIILANPMGVSKLMDLLVDSREVIRNDVSFVWIVLCIFIFHYFISFNYALSLLVTSRLLLFFIQHCSVLLIRVLYYNIMFSSVIY